MYEICPVCNGITALEVPCPNCGKTMEDLGHASDYFGPYSPYEEALWAQLIGQAQVCIPGNCMHFLQCPNCGRYGDKSVDRVTM